MNKIIRENYPASKLPDDLRQGVDPTATVTITIVEEDRPSHVPSLDEIFAERQPPFRTRKDIDEDLRHQRDEWDD